MTDTNTEPAFSEYAFSERLDGVHDYIEPVPRLVRGEACPTLISCRSSSTPCVERSTEDFDGTLAKIAGFGYTQVEPFAFINFFDDLATGLSKHGLAAPTTHMGLLTVDDQDAVFAAAKELGIETIIVPSSDPRRLADRRGHRRRSRPTSTRPPRRPPSYGLRVGYHNHEYELSSTIDGRHGLEVLAEQLEPEVVLEVDTYWAYVGGADVPALLDRLGDRVVALHIKDGDGIAGQQEAGGGGLGIGAGATSSWRPRPSALRVVELDDSEGDLLEAVGASREYLTEGGADGRQGTRRRRHHRRRSDQRHLHREPEVFADTELLAIGDLYPEIAEAKAAEHGVPSWGGNDVVLNNPDIELVINLTPPAVHTEVCGSAIAAGKHVWSEKPLGLDRESGKALLEAAEAAGLRVGCAPDTFLGAGLQAVKRVLASGAIGKPLSALFLMQQPGPDLWHPNPAFLFQEGAGPLFDIGPYYFTARCRCSVRSSRWRPWAPRRASGARSTPARKAGEEFDVTVPSQTTRPAAVRERSVADPGAQLRLRGAADPARGDRHRRVAARCPTPTCSTATSSCAARTGRTGSRSSPRSPSRPAAPARWTSRGPSARTGRTGPPVRWPTTCST